MAFAELLYMLPTDRLRAVVQRRAATLRGVPRTTDKRELACFLATALSAPDSIGKALAETTLPEVRVLIAAIAHGGEVEAGELVRLAAEGSRERILLAMEGLEAAGLALWDRRVPSERIFVPKSVRQHAPLPLPLRHRLIESLARYDDRTLQLIADNLQLDLPARTDRTGAISMIRGALTSGLDRHLDRLSEEAQGIFQVTVDRGGFRYLQEIANSVDARKRNQLMGWGWSQHWMVGKPRNGVEELLAFGLTVMDDAEGWGRWRLVIPSELLSVHLGIAPFRNIAPEEPAWELLPSEKAQFQSVDFLLRDIAYIMGYVGRAEAARTGTGNMHKTAIKAMARGLSTNSPGYPELIYALARDAGLIAPDHRKGLYEVTKTGEAWAGEPSHAQLNALYSAWRNSVSWAEPCADPLADDRTYRSYAEIDGYRDSVIKLLIDLAREHGDAFASIASMTAKAEHRWWHRFSLDGDDTEMASSNLEVVRRIGAFTLALLGLTETATGQGVDEVHIRLSALGRHQFLGEPLPETWAESQSQTFSVLPNLEIYAPRQLPARVLYRLFRLGEPRAQGLITLNRETLRRAFDRGESAGAVLAFLRKHSQNPIPQNVEYLIQEVGGRHGHIRVGQAGLYLQVSDPMLLKELKAQKGLKIRFREDIADTVALITGDSVDAVLRQLRGAGFLPVAANTNRHSDEEEEDEEEETYIRPAQYNPPRRGYPDIDSRINWPAVAKSDGLRWPEPQQPVGVKRITSPRDVSKLVELAISEQRCLEIEYFTEGSARANVRIIEPQLLSGTLVTAYCQLREDRRVFNLRNIRWARDTGKHFVKDEG